MSDLEVAVDNFLKFIVKTEIFDIKGNYYIDAGYVEEDYPECSEELKKLIAELKQVRGVSQ